MVESDFERDVRILIAPDICASFGATLGDKRQICECLGKLKQEVLSRSAKGLVEQDALQISRANGVLEALVRTERDRGCRR